MTSTESKTVFDRKFSYSSMKTWRRCRMQYKWHYIDDYEPLPSLGLIRGSVMHTAAGNWYASIDNPSPEDRLRDALQIASNKLSEYEQLLQQDFTDEWYIIDFVLKRYCKWANDNDTFVKVLEVEKRFDIELEQHKIVGYIDGIVEESDGTHWLLEHKFLKRVNKKGLDLDAQVSLYLLAARMLGYNPEGVLYNIVRMTEGGIAAKQPVERVPLFRNAEGLSIIRHEVITQLDEMRDYHINGGTVYRSPDESCTWQCGFFQACLAMNYDGNANAVLSTIPKRQISRGE